MNNKNWFVLIVIALIVIAGYYFNQKQPTVSAIGFASVIAKPDKVSVYVNVDTLNESSKIAQEENTKITEDLNNALIKIGIDKKDITISNFNIYQEYDWTDKGRVEKGYKATRQIIVKSSNFSKVSDIIDSSVSAGALVLTMNFELSTEKENEYKAQALKQAGVDAKNKASSTAAGFGKRLGGLVSVQSQDYGSYTPYPFYARGEALSTADAKNAAVSLDPKDIEVTATINAIYRLSLF